MPFSNYSKNKMGKTFRADAETWPSTLYFAAYTVSPTVAGGGTEVSGYGYARIGVTNSSSNFTVSSTGLFTNTGAITWAAASGGSWGTIVAIGIFDSLSGDHLLAFHTLISSKTIADTDQLNIAAGNMDIQF